jgi:hypothetical protein
MIYAPFRQDRSGFVRFVSFVARTGGVGRQVEVAGRSVTAAAEARVAMQRVSAMPSIHLGRPQRQSKR